MSALDLSAVKVGDTVFIRRAGRRRRSWEERTVIKAGRVWLTVDVPGNSYRLGYGERFRRDTGTHHAPGKGYGSPDYLFTPEMRDAMEQRAIDRELIREVFGVTLPTLSPHYADPSRLAAVLREAQREGKL